MAIRDNNTHTCSFLILVYLFVGLVSQQSAVESFLFPLSPSQLTSLERTRQFTVTTSLSSKTNISRNSRLYIQRGKPGRSAPHGKDDKSKRQYRVGELVRTELAHILRSGLIKGKGASHLNDELRSRISIINVDVSPDLRQARVSVSIRGGGRKGSQQQQQQQQTVPSQQESDKVPTTADAVAAASSSSSSTVVIPNDPTVDKRRIYSWLVENTNPIRHTLAQRMSHLKTSPSLTFTQVDVSAAVDVMYLIEKVTNGYERERIGEYGGNDDTLPQGLLLAGDEDDEDDDEWEEEDDEFFSS
jgi:ribosome-binding factor A